MGPETGLPLPGWGGGEKAGGGGGRPLGSWVVERGGGEGTFKQHLERAHFVAHLFPYIDLSGDGWNSQTGRKPEKRKLSNPRIIYSIIHDRIPALAPVV